jgi:tetratricopeptide (TPR) repeat protein
LGAGKGWATIDRSDQAVQAYDQVHLLAIQSPYLQMAQRRDLLSVLAKAYADLGDQEKAAACHQEIVDLDQETNSQPPAMAAPLPSLPQGTDPVSSPEVGTLEEARRQAAYALLQAVSEGAEPPSALVGELGQALQGEDAAKLALYQQQLEATSQPGKRINAQWHLVRWLMVKYQVAVRGLGLSVVPEWEAQLPAIQSALAKAYEGLYFDYEDQVTAQPDASLMGPGSYLVRRQVLLAGRLGQYPNYPAEQMANKLQDAVATMIAAGSRDRLYLDVAVEEGGLQFYLSPADRYGQPAQSP